MEREKEKYLAVIDREIRDLEVSLDDPGLSRSNIADIKKMLRQTKGDRARIANS